MQACLKSDVKFDEAGLIFLVEAGLSQVSMTFFSYIDALQGPTQSQGMTTANQTEGKYRDDMQTGSNETDGAIIQVKHIRSGNVISKGGILDRTWVDKRHKTGVTKIKRKLTQNYRP